MSTVNTPTPESTAIIIDRVPARNRHISREYPERLSNMGASEYTIEFVEQVIRRRERTTKGDGRQTRLRALAARLLGRG